MSVDIHTSDESWVGTSSGSLISFFDTITYRLENKQRGSVFPAITHELYYGTLEPGRISTAIKDLQAIQKQLTTLPPSDVIWDMEDLSKQPPWGDNIAKDITNLAEYFTTSDGKNLIEVLLYALEHAKKDNAPITIR